MRIFYLSRINVGIEDASVRHVWEFCHQFVKLGHQVTLFVPDMGSRKALAGVSIVHIPVLIRKSSITFFSFYFLLSFFFVYHCLKSRPDLIYTRHQPMEWLTTWLKFVFKLSYVIEVNGLAPVEMKINGQPDWYISIIRWLEKICYRLSDRIVTPSPLIKDYLLRNYSLDKDHFLVVTNGANPEISRPMDKEACRTKIGLDPSGKFLVFVGSLKKWHGIERIVGIMPKLVETIPDVHLLIVGDGEKKDQIKQMVSDLNFGHRVILTGRVPFEEVPCYINAADICLAPYFEERLNETGISPLKIFEYLACGKPVITNPVGGLEKLFEKYQVGILIESNRPDEWVQPIAQLLNDPDRMKIYGDNGFNAVRDEFSWEAVCKKIEKNLADLVASK